MARKPKSPKQAKTKPHATGPKRKSKPKKTVKAKTGISERLQETLTSPFWVNFTQFYTLLALVFPFVLLTTEFLDQNLSSALYLSTETSGYDGFLTITLFSMVLLCLPVLLVIIFRRTFRDMLGVAPFVIALIVLFIDPFIDPNGIMQDICLGFMVTSSLVAFIYFIVAGRVRSWSFFLFTLLIMSQMGWIYALILLALVGFSKFLFLAIKQNWDAFMTLGLRKVIVNLAVAFLYWSPMLIVIIPSLMLSQALQERAVKEIYENTYLEAHTDPRDFKTDLSISLDTLEIEQREALNDRLDNLETLATDGVERIPKELGDAIRGSAVKASVEFDCAWYNVACHGGEIGAKAAVGAANEASQASFKKLGDSIEQTVGGILNESNKELKHNLELARTQVDALVKQTRDTSEAATLNTMMVIQFLLLISLLIFLFVAIKSYLYVFARVLFSKGYGTTVTLQGSKARMTKGNIRKCGGSYTITASTRSDFYVSRKYEPSGRPPRFSLPQYAVGILPRIRNKCWVMNKLIMETGRTSVKFQAPGGKEFVEWDVNAGETVIFRFKNFVAMSETITLRRVISLRLSSLLMGRMFFSTATGPGKLVFMCEGKPIAGTDRAAHYSVPENRIIAFQKHTHFNVESELNPVDVFFSGIYLKKKATGMVVIDSDQHTKAPRGIVQFVTHFLLPV